MTDSVLMPPKGHPQHSALPSLAIIVAARNEAHRIVKVLEHYRALLPDAELIVADGASRDATAREALPYARVVTGKGSLGANQNLAAAAATADVLLFVHADTFLANVATVRRTMMDATVVGGAYRLRFDDDARVYQMMARRADQRSLAGAYTGDQGIFVRRSVFVRLGGFPTWPLMEDVAFSERLRGEGRLVLLDAEAITSTRRHKAQGPYRLIGRVMLIRLLYRFGASPDFLARLWRRGGDVVPDRLPKAVPALRGREVT
ncbi:MAG: glycosyltransferase [Thermomicrobia bacterium]|nr:glycosyltransferase [Thermomicrobia bacterium]